MDEWHVQVMESTTANVLSSIQSISDRVERLERECEERWAQVEAAKKRGLELGALLDSRRKTRSILERDGHRVAMSLNSLHLCLTDTKTRTRHLTEQCKYLASRKAMAEEAEPALDEHTLFLPCRLVVEAESTRNVVRIFVQHMQKKAEELRQQIGEQRAALNALVQNALRRGHDDEVMTLHSQVMSMKSSVARLRSDNARLQKHCDDRALELKSRRSRTCEMGKKLQDTEAAYFALMTKST